MIDVNSRVSLNTLALAKDSHDLGRVEWEISKVGLRINACKLKSNVEQLLGRRPKTVYFRVILRQHITTNNFGKKRATDKPKTDFETSKSLL